MHNGIIHWILELVISILNVKNKKNIKSKTNNKLKKMNMKTNYFRIAVIALMFAGFLYSCAMKEIEIE